MTARLAIQFSASHVDWLTIVGIVLRASTTGSCIRGKIPTSRATCIGAILERRISELNDGCFGVFGVAAVDHQFVERRKFGVE
jgi:hypothetical protein